MATIINGWTVLPQRSPTPDVRLSAEGVGGDIDRTNSETLVENELEVVEAENELETVNGNDPELNATVERYEIDRIIGVKAENPLKYLVLWMTGETTWEPAFIIETDAPLAVEEFIEAAALAKADADRSATIQKSQME